jgi:tRNA threonylcarbamoyladenosine biosynthesis protein TsaB
MCSVALFYGKKLLAIKEQGGAYSHAENLTVFIQELFQQTGVDLKSIDAIAVSKGPGSYTGLRIGVSTAKGLAFALNKPIIAIDTLFAMASYASSIYKNKEEVVYCPMIDARRMEVYCAIYNAQLSQIKPIAAEIITDKFFSELLVDRKIYMFGDGAEKCRALFNDNSKYIFSDEEYISAKGLIHEALNKWYKNEFEDIAYFEPFYLKDFVSTHPAK